MVTGYGPLERLLRLWLPVGFFLVLALFPFYSMAVTSLKPNAELYNRRVMPLSVIGSAVLPSNTSIATGQPLGAQSRP
jgi:ABC-type glycerol-3-phosphate transport system permease component